jgi:hypothetical protein
VRRLRVAHADGRIADATPSEGEAVIVYVSIGNSDDKLTQQEWALFFSQTAILLQRHAKVHGQWASEPASAWQNACWCIEIVEGLAKSEFIQAELVGLADRFHQDSIAWAEVKSTVFLGAPVGAR